MVVSPLIALQRDQVLALRESGAVSAAAANSTVRAKHRREALEDFEAGELELLFLAPEQLANPGTLQALTATNVSLLVVDEAHCSAPGATTSGPSTCGWARWPTSWGARGCWR